MVYESDFYTTRRPYSSSRPYVSSYTVTVRTIPHMPYVAHRKLVSIVHSPMRIYHSGTYLPIKIHTRIRPSIIAAELNRIRYLTRPSYGSYTNKYLNSRDYIDFDDTREIRAIRDSLIRKIYVFSIYVRNLKVDLEDFDDETRDIRARSDNLLRKIHVYVPRPCLSEYNETAPERLRSDDYVRRIINAKNARKEIESLPWYTTPEKRDIGEGHLACIKYAGGRPQSRRRPYYTVGDLIPGDVKTDVKLMSYYMKNRKAAEDASALTSIHPSHKETHDAPAHSSVTWADEVIPEEEPREQPVEEQTTEEPLVEEITAEIALKPKKKKDKKLKVKENNEEQEDMEAEYDENGVKKQPDEDTIKRVQEYLDKKAAEKKAEEERRAWEEAERKKAIEEKELARLAKLKLEEDIRRAEIKEQERLEAERQAVIQKAEEQRLESERLKEDEKLFNEAVAQAIADEQERLAKEHEEAVTKKKQEEEEEKMANVLTATNGVSNGLTVDQATYSEEHSIHADLSDQDNEAKPYEVDHDEDTQVEEDEHEEPEELENPFIDGEGAASSLQADEPVEDTPRIRQSGGAGADEGFDWGDYEDEPEVKEAVAEAATPEVDEETAPTAEEQVFDEAEVESQNDAVEAQVEEADVTQEAQVEETQVTEEAQAEEETQEAEQTQAEEETQEAEEAETEETQVAEEETEAEAEAEVKSEKSAHDEEEEEEEEED